MRDREIACQYYKYEGSCAKGHTGTFHKACQTCREYFPTPGGEPARYDRRRHKKEKINKREFYDDWE